MLENIRLAFQGIWSHKMRSFLTMLGIIIGIASIIAIVSTIKGTSEQIKEDLERRTGLEVILWDERLSTVEAERILMDTGVRRENRKQYVDKMAAAVILQNYLDSQAHEGQTE